MSINTFVDLNTTLNNVLPKTSKTSFYDITFFEVHSKFVTTAFRLKLVVDRAHKV